MAAHVKRRRKQPSESAGEVTRPPGLQVDSTVPCPHTFPVVGLRGPLPNSLHGGQGETEQRGGRRALEHAARLWVPRRVRMVTSQVASVLTNKAAMTPRQASPAPASGLPQAPRPQRPTVHLPKGFLRPCCAPGPRTRCAGTWAAPTAFPHPGLHLGPLSLLIVDKHSSTHMFPVADNFASGSLNIHSPFLV